MAEVEIFVTGDQIGTFSGVSTSGNNNGTKVTLSGVQSLGSETDVFRIVVRQVNEGDTLFSNGQIVDIHDGPTSDPSDPPIYSNLNPQHDQFQGRASSADHQIFTSPENIVFDVNGVSEGTMQYGPGADPPRTEQLSFETLEPDTTEFPCFVAGTLVETVRGPRPVERICVGGLVKTLDHGLQPVRWVGRKEVPGAGAMAPILIRAGALGNSRDLWVSPQHRMLLGDWRTELFFGQGQVLVAAAHLVNGGAIRQVDRPWVCYVHLAFDRHEVIWAEGIASESLYLGAEAIAALGKAAQAEIRALFGDEPMQTRREPLTARHCLRRWEGALVACA
ncbi:MAG: Hint domain [Rhodobacteraceae bacterium HLUCCO07]|nr:MAG: Hint domain [Rhodobacteraceae bacterium HLUCCO07]